MVGTDDGVLGMKIVMVLKRIFSSKFQGGLEGEKTRKWFTKMRVATTWMSQEVRIKG